jgi:hypothetical protein
VLLLGAPRDLALRPLPEGVVVSGRATGPPYDVGLAFCADLASLVQRWERGHRSVTEAGRLWVAWPKRSSGVPTDLDENVVRDHGLAHGRVDVKVCAIDDVWSGLKHVIRVADRRS